MKKEYNNEERLSLEEIVGGFWIEKLNVVLDVTFFLSMHVFMEFPKSNSLVNELVFRV